MAPDSVLWTEEFRPSKIADVIGNENIKRRLSAYVNNPEKLPQLMVFVGLPGTGKTSMAHALKREMLKNSHDFIEYNASDERGVDFIREEVKSTASNGTLSGDAIKIIFLDEADYLTPDAQAILRRTIEKWGQRTKFIFGVNYVNKVKGPILSRGRKYYFRPPTETELMGLISKIATIKKFDIGEDSAKRIIEYHDRAPRDIVMALEECYMIAHGGTITDEIVSVALEASISTKYVADTVKQALMGNIKGALDMTNDILYSGVSCQALLDKILTLFLKSQEKEKFKNPHDILKAMAYVDVALNEGGIPVVQLAWLYSEMNLGYKDECRKEIFEKYGKKA